MGDYTDRLVGGIKAVIREYRKSNQARAAAKRAKADEARKKKQAEEQAKADERKAANRRAMAAEVRREHERYTGAGGAGKKKTFSDVGTNTKRRMVTHAEALRRATDAVDKVQ